MLTGGHPGSDSQFLENVGEKDTDGTALFPKTCLAKSSAEDNSWLTSQNVKDTNRKLDAVGQILTVR